MLREPRGELQSRGSDQIPCSPFAWSASQASGLQSSVSLRWWKWGQSLGQFPAACWLALSLVFVLFLLFPLCSRRAAVDLRHVASTWCCLVEDYHPIRGWFLENALCCTASREKGPEWKYLIWKEMLLWGKPSGDSCSISGIELQKSSYSLHCLRIWFSSFTSFLTTFIHFSVLHWTDRVKWK